MADHFSHFANLSVTAFVEGDAETSLVFVFDGGNEDPFGWGGFFAINNDTSG